MCPYLNRYGIKDFAVASLDEALELRRNGIIGNILILGYVYHKVKIYDLTVSITSYEHARILNDRKIRIKCHLQIDTMMKRLGIDYKETEYIKEVFKLKYLKITGVYSHLCDVKDKDFTVRQLKSYDKVVMLKINGYSFKTHIQATEALFRYPEYKYDYVRIGIGLYGYGDKSLKPVMSVRSRI
ncbi:MAG: alanine racemase, partial [Solobacterium sp.]|nr:alanine racemase [Solobacterium sp.]